LAIHQVKNEIKDFDIKNAISENLDIYLEFIPENLHSYLIAAIRNHEITKKALLEFNKPDLDIKKIGSLMNDHHDVLKNVLKITVPKIDNMIDAALKAGAYGAKIVGSGRGGSIVAIAPKDKEETVINSIKLAGGFDAYKVAVDPGARIVETSNV
jgi:galactokinase